MKIKNIDKFPIDLHFTKVGYRDKKCSGNAAEDGWVRNPTR